MEQRKRLMIVGMIGYITGRKFSSLVNVWLELYRDTFQLFSGRNFFSYWLGKLSAYVDHPVIGSRVGMKLLLGDGCPVIINWIINIHSVDNITLEYFYMPFVDNLKWNYQGEGCLSIIFITDRLCVGKVFNVMWEQCNKITDQLDARFVEGYTEWAVCIMIKNCQSVL